MDEAETAERQSNKVTAMIIKVLILKFIFPPIYVFMLL